MTGDRLVPNWLPEGKRAAIIFHIDDVHPGRSTDPYEAGGDLDRGALRHAIWLLERHPKLRMTLFVTPDWREISPHPTRRLLSRLPWLNRRLYLAPRHPRGKMRLDRHPDFVDFIRTLPRTEVALHGLHHTHPGPAIPVEFQRQDVEECRRILREAIAIFRDAGLPFVPGITPPGFAAPDHLLAAIALEGLSFVASARDIETPVEIDALAAMTGLTGVPLFRPAIIQGGALVHIPTNFQATSRPDRAHAIIENGGLLSIKAHIIKNCMGHIALDGMDDLYRNYLDVLFEQLDERWGDSLWWTSMSEVAARLMNRGRQ